MELLNEKIVECLKQGEICAIATIMASKGSTPRTSGTKMVVLKDRTIYGTIGGGMVEAMVIDACIKLMAQNRCRIIEFKLDQELKDGLDMVCGGSLTVLIETITPSHDMISLFLALLYMEKKGEKAFLVSKVEGISQSDFMTRKCLLPDIAKQKAMNPYSFGESSHGISSMLPIVPKSILDAIQENFFSGISPVIYNHGLEEYIIEPVHIQDKIYIFGAGHVGFQLARIAHITDFQTIITDDREEFANYRRFPHAKAVRVVEHFDHAVDSLPDELSVDANSYIVILTRGHLHDQTVLEAALKTEAAYIGMIGSRTKRDKIYTNLEKKGISRDRLDAVYSPIGLNIHSETPAEIAISIIGQIIQVRAK